MLLAGGCILAGSLEILPDPANAGGGFNLKGRTSGHCELSNVDVGRQLYNGNCTIQQKVTGDMNRYIITMGNTEPFLFATSDGITWMHGPDRVNFRDRGDSGVFKWDDFRLEVHED